MRQRVQAAQSAFTSMPVPERRTAAQGNAATRALASHANIPMHIASTSTHAAVGIFHFFMGQSLKD